MLDCHHSRTACFPALAGNGPRTSLHLHYRGASSPASLSTSYSLAVSRNCLSDLDQTDVPLMPCPMQPHYFGSGKPLVRGDSQNVLSAWDRHFVGNKVGNFRVALGEDGWLADCQPPHSQGCRRGLPLTVSTTPAMTGAAITQQQGRQRCRCQHTVEFMPIFLHASSAASPDCPLSSSPSASTLPGLPPSSLPWP